MISRILAIILCSVLWLTPATAGTILTNAPDYIHSIYGADSTTTSGKAAVHPSVIDFQLQYGIPKWPQTGTGYRYWMGFTTITPEDCYLFASNDNVNWVQIVKYDNNGDGYDPLIPDHPAAEDAEIIYDPTNDSLQLFSVESDSLRGDGSTTTYYSGNGVTRFTLSNTLSLTKTGSPFPITNGVLLLNSPTVVREGTSTTLHIWGIGQAINPATDFSALYKVFHAVSTDNGATWSAPQESTVGWSTAYPNSHINHIEARANPFIAGQVDFLIQATPDLQGGNLLVGDFLAHAIATFSAPTTLTMPLAPSVILAPTTSGWDHTGIYRSSFTLTETGNQVSMQLWYSGIVDVSTGGCYIGYTSGPVYNVDGSGNVQPLAASFSVSDFLAPINFDSPTLSIATSSSGQIFNVDGTPGGSILNVDGSPGGTIH